jgi:hypothetical protein
MLALQPSHPRVRANRDALLKKKTKVQADG